MHGQSHIPQDSQNSVYLEKLLLYVDSSEAITEYTRQDCRGVKALRLLLRLLPE